MLLHIGGWLTRVAEIVARGRRDYLNDGLLQEAGDSLIHQYDEINRQLTWRTLAVDLPAWRASLEPLFASAAQAIPLDPGPVPRE